MTNILSYIKANELKHHAGRTPVRKIVILHEIKTVILDYHKHAKHLMMGEIIEDLLRVYKDKGNYTVFQTKHIE